MWCRSTFTRYRLKTNGSGNRNEGYDRCAVTTQINARESTEQKARVHSKMMSRKEDCDTGESLLSRSRYIEGSMQGKGSQIYL